MDLGEGRLIIYLYSSIHFGMIIIFSGNLFSDIVLFHYLFLLLIVNVEIILYSTDKPMTLPVN